MLHHISLLDPQQLCICISRVFLKVFWIARERRSWADICWSTGQRGDKCEMDGETVERVLGVELPYLNWVLEQDGEFVQGKLEVKIAPL